MKLHSKLIMGLALIAALYACGGGGGGTAGGGGGNAGGITQTAQATTGAPMSLAKVSFKSLTDSTTAIATADAVGSVTVPTGVTYPILVRGTSPNGTFTYYGFVSDANQATVAVNPLSTLVLALSSGMNPGKITAVTDVTTNLTAAKTAVATIFSNIFTQFSIANTTDLLSTTFTQNHTGLDLILDAMSIRVQTDGSVNLCNKLAGSCVTGVTVSNASAIPFSNTNLTNLNSVPFATCSSAITNMTVTSLTTDSSLYSNSFLNSGMNTATYKSAMATKFGSGTYSFQMPIFLGKDGNNNFLFSYTVFNSATNSYWNDFTMAYDSSCLMVGNQFPFDIMASPMVSAEYRVDLTNNPSPSSNVTSTPVSGLWFKVGSDSQPVVYAGATPAKAKFELCDNSSNCSQIATMNYGGGGTFFHMDSSNYTNGTDYSFLNLVPYSSIQNLNFYNGNPNPIKVTFYDAQNAQLGSPVKIKMFGDIIPQSVVTNLTMPTVTNASDILNNIPANPTLSFSTNSGIVVAAVTVQHGQTTSQPPQTAHPVVTNVSGSTTFDNYSMSTNDTYRAIYLNAQIPGNPTKMVTKYVWAPTCPGCY
jgi:hypothetical protein